MWVIYSWGADERQPNCEYFGEFPLTVFGKSPAQSSRTAVALRFAECFAQWKPAAKRRAPLWILPDPRAAGFVVRGETALHPTGLASSCFDFAVLVVLGVLDCGQALRKTPAFSTIHRALFGSRREHTSGGYRLRFDAFRLYPGFGFWTPANVTPRRPYRADLILSIGHDTVEKPPFHHEHPRFDGRCGFRPHRNEFGRGTSQQFSGYQPLRA
jgi:hypothetical protein